MFVLDLIKERYEIKLMDLLSAMKWRDVGASNGKLMKIIEKLVKEGKIIQDFRYVYRFNYRQEK